MYRKQDVTAFDAWQGQVAILLRAHGRAQVVLRSGKGSEYQRDLEEIEKSSGDGFCKMLCMGEDRLLILNQGEVYFWDAGDGTFTKIMSEEGEAVDIARVGDRFAILYTEHNRYRKPRFELYELMDSVTRPNLLSPDA